MGAFTNKFFMNQIEIFIMNQFFFSFLHISAKMNLWLNSRIIGQQPSHLYPSQEIHVSKQPEYIGTMYLVTNSKRHPHLTTLYCSRILLGGEFGQDWDGCGIPGFWIGFFFQKRIRIQWEKKGNFLGYTLTPTESRWCSEVGIMRKPRLVLAGREKPRCEKPRLALAGREKPQLYFEGRESRVCI
jgi:hypothetical protein